jgi:eukaryotic-like serine/threonine-protein kinase
VSDADATLPGFESEEPDDLERRGPVRVGRYALLEQLGAGAMGVVHAAYDPELDRKVALKLLHPSRQDDAGRQQLISEAQTLAKLSHPNVVAVHDAGTHGDRVFITMAHVDGESLRSWLDRLDRRDPSCWRKVLTVMVEAGKGLQAAHEAGLIHRDFKPHNVLVGTDGGVQVVDFGLAVRPAASSEQHESPRASIEGSESDDHGRIVGTPSYMAPELFGGAPADQRSDQFAYCATLYEGLFGERPFAGRTVAALACAVLEHRMRPIPDGSSVPLWLRRVVLRGLSHDPNGRWSSMAVLLQQLGRDPLRVWRGRVFLVGGLAVVGIAGIGIGERLGTSGSRCSGSLELVQVWSPERRERVSAALAGAGPAYAEETTHLVTEAIDHYAHGWIEHHDDACRAHERGERSIEVLDLQMACLGRRKQRLSALVGVFEQADSEVLENASAAIDALPPLSICADLDAVREWVEPPTGPLADAVEKLTVELVQAEAQGAAGRYGEARRALGEILPRARELEHGAFTAEVLLASGVMAMRDEVHAESQQLLDDAWRTALASGHDEVATRALIAAIEGTQYGPSDLSETHRRAADAQAMVERLLQRGVPAAKDLQVDLLFARGQAERRYANLSEGIALLESALARYEALGESRPLRLADILVELGSVHFLTGDHEDALASYRRALDIRLEMLGKLHPKVAAVHNNLGLVYKNLDQYDRATSHLEQALAITMQQFHEGHALVLRSRRNLANLYRESNRLEDARRTYEELLAAIGDGPLSDFGEMTVEVLFLQAQVLEALERAPEAQAYRTRGLQVAETNGSDLLIAQALWYTGNSLASAGDLDGCIEAHERVLALIEGGTRLRQGESGHVHWKLGEVLWERDRPGDQARARSLMRTALERAKKDPNPRAYPFRDRLAAWLHEHE